MIALFHLIGIFIANLFKPRRQLAVENLFTPASAQYLPAAGTAPFTTACE